MDNSIIVTVCCLTYNHEKFIRQCLDGFIIQKTNFHFEVLIHDDASTDRTQQIICEYAANYPDMIRPIFQTENQYSKGTRAILATFCYPQARGKYIALCEGDDYWTDPLKLQKQVDFLEQNPDYGMIYTLSQIYKQNEKRIDETYLFGAEYKGYYDLLAYNRVATLTTCVRTEILMEYIKDIKPQERNWLMGDYPMWLWIGFYYKIKFLPEVTSVYRLLEESASHSKDIKKNERFILSAIDITSFFIKKFNLSPTDLYYYALNENYYKLFSEYKQLKDYTKAMHYSKCIDNRHASPKMRKEKRKFYLKYFIFKVRNILHLRKHENLKK